MNLIVISSHLLYQYFLLSKPPMMSIPQQILSTWINGTKALREKYDVSLEMEFIISFINFFSS